MERLVLPARLDNLERMFTFIRAAASKQGFDPSLVNKIQLASEEALVNVISYAYPAGGGTLEIVCDNLPDRLQITVIDSGKAFDPLALPDPDINAPMEKRRIGGLGIYLMKQIMDEVSYARENERNVLTMVKYYPERTAVRKESASRWPVNFMKQENYNKGDVLFKAGDKADRMFYIKSGSIRLPEINKTIKAGEVIGEMGIFSPFKERTASAVCEEDVEAFTMGREEVIKFFGHDPALAIDLIQLSIKRFIENLKAETAARERIESELRIAHEIQSSMLPTVFPQRQEFELFAMMDPAKEVGGDFYDFFFVDENRLCCVIGDVSGKGVPAALFMAITKTLIKTVARQSLSTSEVLARVNNILCPDNQTCLFVTVFFLIIDIKSGMFEYTNAGHNPPLIVAADGGVEYMKIPGGFVVGVMENVRCEDRKVQLKPGDTIFLYTDGVTEAMDPEQKQFSETRLKAALEKVKTAGPKEMIEAVRREVFSFARGASQSDDITMLAIKLSTARPGLPVDKSGGIL